MNGIDPLIAADMWEEEDGPPDKKDVYAHFGLAMYFVQVVETGLIDYVVLADTPPVTLRTAVDDRFSQRGKDTFGTLVDQARRHLGDDPFGAELLVLAERRDWLAHRYFRERAAEFMTRQGREGMLRELTVAREEFLAANARLDELTAVLMRERGVTDEMLKTAGEEIRSRGYTALAPFGEPLPKFVEIVSVGVWRADPNDSRFAAPVLTTSTGERLTVGDRGLCLSEAPVDQIEQSPFPADALPARVRTRPTGAVNWNYSIQLGGGYELSVNRRDGDTQAPYGWDVRKSRQPPR